MSRELTYLVDLLRDGACTVLTGAGISTESGIPDYRGPHAPPRRAPPIQHSDFIKSPAVRRRYWARSAIGWPTIRDAEPNRGHRALADLQRAGLVSGLITQNVDRLHSKANSDSPLELHGALADVICLDCEAHLDRNTLQAQLVARNAEWLATFGNSSSKPDGDAELPTESAQDVYEAFTPIACMRCDGVLKPDVVFFGGSVPRPKVERAYALVDGARALIVIGSSLTVFSGYRFAKFAADPNIPLAIVALGSTRADPIATVKLDHNAGAVLNDVCAALL